MTGDMGSDRSNTGSLATAPGAGGILELHLLGPQGRASGSAGVRLPEGGCVQHRHLAAAVRGMEESPWS